MNEKFTPGPWKISHLTGDVMSDDGTIIHEVDSNHVNKNRYKKANAHLIAAAPDMYEVLSELEESSSYWSEYDVPIGIPARILAALKKSRGEQ